MRKIPKWLVIFLAFDAVVIGGYFGYKALRPGGSDAAEAYAWVIIDQSYVPKNDVEAFIKTDADNRGALPVQIRNYGSDPKILGRFKGRKYAKPSEKTLEMLNQGLDDWMIVDIRYKAENDRDVIRTMLYLFVKGAWIVGDTGELVGS
ncbi:MAG: hypothetical protein JW843_07330 [Candidatus Aminicenantes bacterium]|nr:hypothetical protein [Candidatus Aminicenantes bacterium]